ncbi:MAG: hypothetical protein R6V15_08740, partial [Desulfotignum sp.]
PKTLGVRVLSYAQGVFTIGISVALSGQTIQGMPMALTPVHIFIPTVVVSLVTGTMFLVWLVL